MGETFSRMFILYRAERGKLAQMIFRLMKVKAMVLHSHALSS